METATQYQTEDDRHEVRDARTENRFFVDNIIIQGYGPKIGVYGIAVYSALCMHSKPSTQKCWPSHRTIAEEIGCSLPKVKETLRQLEQLKLIRVEPYRDQQTGRQTSNTYTLLDPPPITNTPDPTDTRPRYRDKATMNNPNDEQSQENPPVGDSSPEDFFGPDGPPQHQPVKAELPQTSDPLVLAGHTAKKGNGRKSWTVTGPEGADPWADGPLDAFKALAWRDTLKPSECKNWARRLQQWAEEEWHATPAETVQAIRSIPDSEHGWQTFKTPYDTGFLTAMDAMIDRIRSGKPINAKGTKPGNTPAVSTTLQEQINAAFRKAPTHATA